MGVYGYGHDEPVVLPDGYLDVRFDTADGREAADSIVYPTEALPILGAQGRAHSR